jgi:hypothetical protein
LSARHPSFSLKGMRPFHLRYLLLAPWALSSSALADVSHSCVYNCGGGGGSDSGGYYSGDGGGPSAIGVMFDNWAEDADKRAAERRTREANLNQAASYLQGSAAALDADRSAWAQRSLESLAGSVGKTFDGAGTFQSLTKGPEGVPKFDPSIPPETRAADAQSYAVYDEFMRCLESWAMTETGNFDLPGLLACSKGAVSDPEAIWKDVDRWAADFLTRKNLGKLAKKQAWKNLTDQAGLKVLRSLFSFHKPITVALKVGEQWQVAMISSLADEGMKIEGAKTPQKIGDEFRHLMFTEGMSAAAKGRSMFVNMAKTSGKALGEGGWASFAEPRRAGGPRLGDAEFPANPAIAVDARPRDTTDITQGKFDLHKYDYADFERSKVNSGQAFFP